MLAKRDGESLALDFLKVFASVARCIGEARRYLHDLGLTEGLSADLELREDGVSTYLEIANVDVLLVLSMIVLRQQERWYCFSVVQTQDAAGQERLLTEPNNDTAGLADMLERIPEMVRGLLECFFAALHEQFQGKARFDPDRERDIAALLTRSAGGP